MRSKTSAAAGRAGAGRARGATKTSEREGREEGELERSTTLAAAAGREGRPGTGRARGGRTRGAAKTAAREGREEDESEEGEGGGEKGTGRISGVTARGYPSFGYLRGRSPDAFPVGSQRHQSLPTGRGAAERVERECRRRLGGGERVPILWVNKGKIPGRLCCWLREPTGARKTRPREEENWRQQGQDGQTEPFMLLTGQEDIRVKQDTKCRAYGPYGGRGHFLKQEMGSLPRSLLIVRPNPRAV